MAGIKPRVTREDRAALAVLLLGAILLGLVSCGLAVPPSMLVRGPPRPATPPVPAGPCARPEYQDPCADDPAGDACHPEGYST